MYSLRMKIFLLLVSVTREGVSFKTNKCVAKASVVQPITIVKNACVMAGPEAILDSNSETGTENSSSLIDGHVYSASSHPPQ